MDIRNLKIISIFVFLLISIGSVLALGVSSPYWKDNPLEMYPGQIKNIEFSLSNRPDAESATAFVVLTESAGIAELINGPTYTVQPGTADTKIILKITIPESAQIGNIYDVEFSVKSAPPTEAGTVQVGVGYNVGFPVKVVGKSEIPETTTPATTEAEEETSNTIIWVLVIAIILIIIILFFVKRKK